MADYKTLRGTSTFEYEEKRSRFIATASFADTEERALAVLNSVRAANRTARHNVYAYVLQNGRTRYSDDGEPAKTAGTPVLETINHAGVADVIVVVTRYFGGILLGTGGLVRAYTQGAQVAVAAAGVQRMSLYTVALIACPYNLYEIILHLLPDHDCAVEETDYGADDTLTVTLGSEMCIRDRVGRTSSIGRLPKPRQGRFTPRSWRPDSWVGVSSKYRLARLTKF